MHNYELRNSRLPGYDWLCMSMVEPVKPTGTGDIRTWCRENFGLEGSKDSGVWYDGLLGFYFKHREHAVQFILTWG